MTKLLSEANGGRPTEVRLHSTSQSIQKTRRSQASPAPDRRHGAVAGLPPCWRRRLTAPRRTPARISVATRCEGRARSARLAAAGRGCGNDSRALSLMILMDDDGSSVSDDYAQIGKIWAADAARPPPTSAAIGRQRPTPKRKFESTVFPQHGRGGAARAQHVRRRGRTQLRTTTSAAPWRSTAPPSWSGPGATTVVVQPTSSARATAACTSKWPS